LFDHLAGAGQGKLHRLFAQLGDGLVLLALDVALGALQQLLLLATRLLEHVLAHLLGHGAAVGDELLRLAARRVDLRLMLGE
jgi:hypothetical protein